MDMRRIVFLAVVLTLLPAAAHAQGKSAHKDVYLYFVWPQDGTVIKVRSGAASVSAIWASPTRGTIFKTAGHHHLLIDVNSPLAPNEPIPQDKNHLHFAAGQTEARIELPPGKHTLQLVLGDAKHYPFKPPARVKADHHHGQIRKSGTLPFIVRMQANSGSAFASTRQHDEIRIRSRFVADAIVGYDQRRARRQQLSDPLPRHLAVSRCD